jgi:hypothetical protein
VIVNADRPAFKRAAIQKDIEELKEFLEQERPEKRSGQMGLL